MYSKEEILEILEAFDLTRSFRAAAALTGCDPITPWPTMSLLGGPAADTTGAGRAAEADRRVPGQDRGVGGTLARQDPRRRGARQAGCGRVHRLGAHGAPGGGPGEGELSARDGGGCIGRGSPSRACGPSGTGGRARRIAGRATNLFCAWLAWCRFRVVIPTWDRTLPTVIGCLDRAMRAFGGCPTYWLTDNETHRDRSITSPGSPCAIR